MIFWFLVLSWVLFLDWSLELVLVFFIGLGGFSLFFGLLNLTNSVWKAHKADFCLIFERTRSVCFGFWHVTLASDPRSFPRKLWMLYFTTMHRSLLILCHCLHQPSCVICLQPILLGLSDLSFLHSSSAMLSIASHIDGSFQLSITEYSKGQYGSMVHFGYSCCRT